MDSDLKVAIKLPLPRHVSHTGIFRLMEFNQGSEQITQDFMKPWRQFDVLNAERYWPYYMIYSGSVTEKSQTPLIFIDPTAENYSPSDIDKMFVLKNCFAGSTKETPVFCSLDLENLLSQHNCHHAIHSAINKHFLHTDVYPPLSSSFHRYHAVLQIESESCYPGYTRLVSSKQFEIISSLNYVSPGSYIFTLMNLQKPYKRCHNTYIENNFFVKKEELTVPKSNNDQGPAMEVPGGFSSKVRVVSDVDMVYAFRSHYIPCCALPMLKRKPKSGIPSMQMKAKILLKGCLLVAVGHKLSKNSRLEWRFSFSESEIMLCSSWNKVQLYTYKLLKWLKFTHFKGMISSYLIKTCIFYCIETFECDIWRPEMLLHCIKKVLSYLIASLEERRLPNYFIDSNNLLGHWTKKQAKRLGKIIKHIKTDLTCCIMANAPKNAIFYAKTFMTWDAHSFDHFLHVFIKSVESTTLKTISMFIKIYYPRNPSNAFLEFEKRIAKTKPSRRELIAISLISLEHAHYTYIRYKRENCQDSFLLSYRLFSKRLDVDPTLGEIHLAWFHYSEDIYNIALSIIREIPASQRKFVVSCCFVDEKEGYLGYASDGYPELVDPLDIMFGMSDSSYGFKRYNLPGNSLSSLWICNSVLFANFIEIVCLIKLGYEKEAGEKLNKYIELHDMLLHTEDVAQKYIDSSQGLLYYMLFLFAFTFDYEIVFPP